MKHTLDELLGIVYRYYPRGVGISDDIDINAREATEEHARLVAARRKAAADERWHAILRRIAERFPKMLENASLHLPTGNYDACYSFTVHLPTSDKRTPLWFQISFLAPYYIIHSSRTIDLVIHPRDDAFRVIVRGMHFFVSRSPSDPKAVWSPDAERLKPYTVTREYVTFDLSPDEQPYAEWIARDIEATFGCERMPPEVGTVLVPDLTVNSKFVRQIRLYDCFFSNNHQWVKPSPSDELPCAVEVDVRHLTGPFIAVLTVLAALYHIMVPLMPETLGPFYWGAVTTDGVLHKEEALKVLAKIRQLLDPPVTPRGIAAKRELEAATRELEALIAAWDGEGAPPDAMIASASGFLTNWVVDESSE